LGENGATAEGGTTETPSEGGTEGSPGTTPNTGTSGTTSTYSGNAVTGDEMARVIDELGGFAAASAAAKAAGIQDYATNEGIMRYYASIKSGYTGWKVSDSEQKAIRAADIKSKRNKEIEEMEKSGKYTPKEIAAVSSGRISRAGIDSIKKD